jgi:hypothetical protein
MKRTAFFLIALILVAGLMLAVALFVPLPVNPYLDFQVLYRANQGILQGIPLYDRAGQVQMIAQQAGLPINEIFVVPFPYPPWYAVMTLPLALFPIVIAARLWFLLNITMLFISVWLLTGNWEPRRRLFSFMLAPLFLPIFGALFVGQYVFPTVLGMALLIYAIRNKRIWLAATGMALVTFKPHVGLLVLLTVLIYLFFRRDEFGRRTFLVVVFTGLILFIMGFFADKAWPITYLQSLLGFKDVSRCQLCVSLPMAISNLMGWGFDQAIPVAGVLLLALSGLFLGHRLGFQKGAEWMVTAPTCIAILVNPYLQNYDFAFLIIPLLVLAGSARFPIHWLWLTSAYLVPWVSVVLFERAGNNVLLIIAVMLGVLVYRLDARTQEA